MAKLIKKPPIKPEVRREWLRRHEEDGESILQIATKDHFDIRTVRRQVQQAKEERESREARTLVLRNAMERHYNDLTKMVERLSDRVSGRKGVSPVLDDEFFEAALRQHLPRSPIWSHLSKLNDLKQSESDQREKLDKTIEDLVKTHPRLRPLTDAGLEGVVPGVVDVLKLGVRQWSSGYTSHSLKDNLVMEPAEEGLVSPRFGFSHMGVMERCLAKTHMPVVRGAIADLEDTIKGLDEYVELKETLTEIGRISGKLREELAVIRLRRIIPGRCKYCPL